MLHPVHCILDDIANNCYRSHEMATLIDLSLSVLFQYTSIRLKECQSSKYYKVISKPDNHEYLLDYHDCLDIDILHKINIYEYYDCVDTLNVPLILD